MLRPGIDQPGTQASLKEPGHPFRKNLVGHMYQHKVDFLSPHQLLKNNPWLNAGANVEYETHQLPDK